jgi:2-polyprenyl-3-methyl-5-hydroxy-6-metoxy-1,4-benzoquinol methylase
VPCDCCGAESWTPLFSENGITLAQCSQCDLLSTQELPEPSTRMTELEEGHYAGGAQRVLEARRQAEAEQVLERRFNRFVELAREFVPAGGRWLDIGCGAGLLPGLAARAGFEAAGIELNEDRRQVASESTGLTIHGEPVEEVAFPDDHFDVVSMINVFSHLVSPSATMDELRRILRPGGVLVMATGEMTDGVQKSHMHDWNLGDHLHFLGDRTLKVYASRIGFEIVHHDRVWLPDEMFSREWLKVRGRSGTKNAVKTVIDRVPGGLAALRAVMLRRQAGSAAHASVFVLRVAR